MLELPDSITNPSTIGFWLLAGAVIALNFGFFASLVFWTKRVRNPFLLGICFFASHAAVGAVALPFIFSAPGELGWILSFSLVLIDFAIAPAMDGVFEGTLFRRVMLYLFLGGAPYAVAGVLVGTIAWLLRKFQGP